MRLPLSGHPQVRTFFSHGLRQMSSRSGSAAAINSVSKLKLLQHHHIKGDDAQSSSITQYSTAHDLQENLRSSFLAWKSLPDPDDGEHRAECPRPRLLSFESTPTYTLGRRQDDPSPEQTARLQLPLAVDLPRRANPILRRSWSPQVRKTNRGGLTTYHGPGQLVLWPILDMRSPLHASYGVASYAAHLESTARRLLAERYGIRTYVNPDEPGVWVAADGGAPQQQERKIAALGVHHRRHVTALGIALNVDVPVAGGEDVNPWARFVPCGLEGKAVTSIAAELGSNTADGTLWDLADLAAEWARIFEEGLIDASKRSFDG